MCNEKFTLNSSLTIHIRVKHTKEKVHTCDMCNKSYMIQRDLNRHRKTHSDKYVCTQCNKNFTNNQSFKIHQEIHNRTIASKVKCEICKQTFKDEKLKRRHIKNNHTDMIIKCDQCNKIYSHPAKLIQHQKCHRSYEEKQYKCTYCTKRFNFSHHLVNHERYHTGIRPYLCSICGNSYSQSHFLTVHMRQHQQQQQDEVVDGGESSSMEQLKCKVCQKVFLTSWRLNRHEKSHDGNNKRQFMCSDCGKQFSMNSSLQRHILRDHQNGDTGNQIKTDSIKKPMTSGERLYKCDQCLKLFITAGLLRKHTKVHLLDVKK